MVATGYIVDEAVFALYFFAIGCLFFLQLMVERAAKFDQKQLNQKQRLYEWKADRKTNVRTSNLTSGDSRAQRSSIDSPLAKTETAGGSTFSNGRSSIHTRDSPHNATRGQTPRKNYSSSPPSPGHAAATTPAVPTLAFPSSHHPPPNHNSDDLESSSMSTGATSEEATTPREQKRHAQANAVPHRHSTMRVGPIQWYFHRLGFAICVLQCIRAIDPYGIHDVLPYAAIAFLHHNSIALLYSAGVIAFFAPIQLIRVVAFRKDTPFLRYFGILLSGLAFVLANLVPIIYGAVGLYKYPRFIFNFYVMVSILVACIVFDVFVHKVAVALQELIDFRARSVRQVSSPGSERALFARSPSQQESDSARSNLSTGAVQMTAVAPTASLAPPASGAARAVETVKEASEHSVSIEDNSNAMDMDSGAQSSSARSSFSEEVRIVIPSLSPHVPTINTEARGPEHVPNKPSQSLQETVSFSSIDTLASSTSISLNANENQASTATTSPSGSTLQLLPSSSSTHLLTQPPSDAAPAPEPARPRVGSVDTPKTGQHTPSHSGRSLTKPDSGRPTIAAPQQSAQNTISPQTRRDAVAEGYKKVVKNLRRFQVLANILVLGAVAALANKSRKELPTAGDLIEPSSANSYSTGDTFFWSSMVLVFGVAILLWYAYMPMGGLCPGYCTCLRKKSRRSKRHSTSTTPQPGSERRPDSASQSREPSSLLSPPSARRLDDHGLVSMGGPVSVESRRSSVAEETTAQLHASAAQA